MGLKWAYENCINAKYFLFIDNDYYLSVKNLMSFLRSPSKYEEYADKHKSDATWNRTNSYYEGNELSNFSDFPRSYSYLLMDL